MQNMTMKTIDEILQQLADEWREIQHTPVITSSNGASSYKGKQIGINLSGEDVRSYKSVLESSNQAQASAVWSYATWLDTARYTVRECADSILQAMRKQIQNARKH